MKNILQLEDCTKDELVHFIRSECFFYTKRLAFTVLMYRAEKAGEERRRESELASKALKECCELLSPCSSTMFIPKDVYTAADEAYKRYMKHNKRSENAEKRRQKIHKEIDAILERK